MGLEAVAIVMAVEEDFRISVSDAEAGQCRTPANLVDLVVTKTQRPRAEVAELIRTIVLEQTGIKPASYHEDADFIRDLKID
jgi:acyl carrier protein